MSLRHTPEEHISRKVLQAVAGAIRSLEAVNRSCCGVRHQQR